MGKVVYSDYVGHVYADVLAEWEEVESLAMPHALPQRFKSVPEGMSYLAYGSRPHGSEANVVHFYVDDYRFEPLWHRVGGIIPQYKFDYLISPDFSVLPIAYYPQQLFQVFRNRMLTRYWQKMYDLQIIFSISWGLPPTYEFCFDGIPPNSVVSVKCAFHEKNVKIVNWWLDGFFTMCDVLQPSQIVVCGQLFPEAQKFVADRGIPYINFASFFDQKRQQGFVW